MGVELATAYITLLPDGSKLGPEVKKIYGGIESQAAKSGVTSGRKLSSSITGTAGKFLKRSVVGVGIAAGGALSASLFKGFGRLQGLEQAEAKLTGLGHSAKSVDKIMSNALAAVKGTAFGMDEAASAAAGAVAAGVKPGRELQKTLTLMGDAATIAGTDMGSMGAIFNKVAASNKIQGDVIAQLNDAGIPIVQLLGKELGTTAEETLKLASEGKVNFATFQKAMQSGLGGAAQESGKTFSGSLANMKAAMGRFGAAVLGGVFAKMPKVLGNVTGAIDKLAPVGERVGAALGDAFAKIGRVAKAALPYAVKGFESIRKALAPIGDWLRDHPEVIKGIAIALGVAAGAALLFAGAMGAVALATSPIALAVVAIAAVGGAAAYAYKHSETFRVAVQTLAAEAVKSFDQIRESVRVALETAVSLWNTFGTTITTYARNSFQNIMQVVQGAMQVIRGIIKTVTSLIKGDWKGAWSGIKTIVSGAWDVIKGVIKQGVNLAKTFLSVGWTAAKEITGRAWEGIKNAASTGIDKVVGKVKELPGKIKELAGAFKDGGKRLGKAMVNGVWAALRNIGGGIGSFAKDITNAIIDLLNDAIPNSLPVPKAPDIDLPNNPIPRLAKGTNNWRGGTTWVGERGPELLNLPKGSQVIPNHKSVRLAGEAEDGGMVNRGIFIESQTLIAHDYNDFKVQSQRQRQQAALGGIPA